MLLIYLLYFIFLLVLLISTVRFLFPSFCVFIYFVLAFRLFKVINLLVTFQLHSLPMLILSHNLLLNTVLDATHKIYIAFLLKFHSKYFLICIMLSSLTHVLLRFKIFQTYSDVHSYIVLCISNLHCDL